MRPENIASQLKEAFGSASNLTYQRFIDLGEHSEEANKYKGPSTSGYPIWLNMEIDAISANQFRDFKMVPCLK